MPSSFPKMYKVELRRRELGLLDKCLREILRCAQDDSPGFVILSAAKDLWRTYG